MGGPGGRAVGCLMHRNVNREPRRLYAGMDLCSPWYYSANPCPQGTGSGEGVTLCCLNLVLAPSESNGRARLDCAQIGVLMSQAHGKRPALKRPSQKHNHHSILDLLIF